MNIVMTGSSGLIGTALRELLESKGHQVFRMLRQPAGDSPFSWQPEKEKIHWDESIPVDAVIHLAGESIAGGRWTLAKKRAIFHSRVDSTRLLARHLAQLTNKPNVFISGSAIGFYGDTQDNMAIEDSPHGKDFLADVASAWEAASYASKNAGIRTINIRTGIVLSKQGGALQQMLLPFKMGLGGVIGNGKQYMSWVALPEIIQMIDFILNNEEVKGAVNLVSPKAVDNRTFTKTLGQVLKRPTVLPMPAFMVRLLFGEIGDLLLLSSIRVYPQKLEDAGYAFQYTDLTGALNQVLGTK